MQRTPLKRRRAKPRKGRTRDLAFLDFVGRQPCLVSGRFGVTVHHVRNYGARDDRRTVPLAAEFHLYQSGPLSIERLGRREFERRFEIDLEAEILRLNILYEELSDKTGT